MATIINADTVVGGAVITGDSSGVLELQTEGVTVATLNADQTISIAGAMSVASTMNVVGSMTTAAINMADNLLTRPVLKDYAIDGSAIGNTGATRTFDLSTANFFSATLDQNCTFTFSNPAGTGDFCGFVLALTNGGAFTITWPASVNWPGGTPPTLTAAGLDILVFVTYNAGTDWSGLVAGLDVK